MLTLVINCGSSSIKYALYSLEGEQVDFGRVERLSTVEEGRGHRQAIREILEKYADRDIARVGHRVAHGGSRYKESALVDDAVLDAIEERIPDAPLHNPYSLEAIRAVMDVRPEIPQVAVFDTAFHSTMPPTYRQYAIDYDVAEQEGIQRFGFHGISHQYASSTAAQHLGRPVSSLKLITLHLGNGASACAVEYGKSIDTSMGNTPLEGLVMGTRSGDVDAGVLLGLMRKGYSIDALEDLLINQSGLKGLSGISNDLRDIEKAAAEGSERALLAINVFAHRARKYIGSYAAAMGGLDGIVFTGGIGEHSHIMRRRILQHLEFLGVALDEDANRNGRADGKQPFIINTARSNIAVVVVPANEEEMIAREAVRVSGAVDIDGVADQRIPIAVSARHCHLTEATFATLFGKDAKPTHLKDLSQPGQFACEEKVNIIGPRGRIDGVRLLGPLRRVDQVEVSSTDSRTLGSNPPVRDSGDVAGSAPIRIEGPAGAVDLDEGLILAWRHIHMTPRDAESFKVSNGDNVAVTVIGSDRDLIFGDVVVRVSESYALEMHIDTDEANAAGISREASGGLLTTDLDEGLRLAPNHPVSS